MKLPFGYRFSGFDIGWRRIGIKLTRERPINPKYRQGIPAGVTVKPEDIALPQLPDDDDPRRKDFWRY